MTSGPDSPAALGRPGAGDPFNLPPDDLDSYFEMAEVIPKKKDKKKLPAIVELPLLAAVALLVAVLVKTFLIQAYWIPSGSMLPTLEVFDRVMVNKLSYVASEPQPGDIVVFSSPFGNGTEDEGILAALGRTLAESVGIHTAAVGDDLIKRVVAVGGDTVEIQGGRLLINGKAVEEPYLPAVTMADSPAQAVEDGYAFVMGDNRDHSRDSRSFGTIPVDTVIGRAFVRIWPISRWSGL